MLWQTCLLLLGIYWMIVRWKNRKFRLISKQLPTKTKGVPILEHAVMFLGDSTVRMKALKQLGEEVIYNNNHGAIAVWLAFKFVVVIGDPEAAETVMKVCLEKDYMLKAVAVELIGNGSIFASVPIWRPRRKILAPTFGMKTLNTFVKIFSTKSTILTDQLTTVAGNGTFSIFERFTKYSMDSVCETALGIHMDTQSIPNHPVPIAFNKYCDMAAGRIVKPWLYSDTFFKWHWEYPQYVGAANVLKGFVTKIVKSKRHSMSQQNNNLSEKEKSQYDEQLTKPKSFLEILVELGGEKGFNDLELQEETLVMLLAGTDTSSVAASFTSLVLAKYPEIQDKVYKEVMEVVGDNEKPIEAEHLPKLKYLDAVIRESLRMYPPVPVIVREIDRNVTLPSGVTLVPGVCVVIHIWAIHRNPKYWGSDANVFRPERFLEGPLKHPNAFIPFSNGVRSCLGYQYAMMSIKVVISQLIRRYRILPKTAPDDINQTDEELPTKFEIMMKHSDNFELKLEMRK